MIRDITIKFALNGWTAKVGCQTLVYVDKDAMMKDLDQYLADPDAKEKEFVANSVNKRLLDGPCMSVPCDAPVAPSLGMPESGRGR